MSRISIAQKITAEEAMWEYDYPDGIRSNFEGSFSKAMHSHPLTRDLFPIKAGYFPEEIYHARPSEKRTLRYGLIVYCVSGVAKLNCDDMPPTTVQPGNLVILPPKTNFFLAAPENEKWSHYWVYCTGQNMENYFRHLATEEKLVDIGLQQKVVDLIELILRHRTKEPSIDGFIYASSVLRHLFSELSVSISSIDSSPRSKRIDIEFLKEYIEDNIQGTIDVATLSTLVNLSRHHFSREFSRETGKSPKQYLTAMRIKKAAELLSNTSLPINLVADRVGYANATHFSKVFKQKTGYKPVSYRHRNDKEPKNQKLTFDS